MGADGWARLSLGLWLGSGQHMPVLVPPKLGAPSIGDFDYRGDLLDAPSPSAAMLLRKLRSWACWAPPR